MSSFSPRQPFAELGTSRLHALQSTKNRQNAFGQNAPFASPFKASPAPSTGKRRAPVIFDEEDSENVDPTVFGSPSKKSKTSDVAFSKPPALSLVASPPKSKSPLMSSPPAPTARKALSSPNTANSTPIGLSRGSPKHKRVGLLSKRRASSSPFRRVDPPGSSSRSSPSIPFSIDAALSGTISNYTPSRSVIAAPPAPVVATPAAPIDESMPKSWFFEIHEDTPEQEAANLMEHSAAVLDISSEDDVETKKRNEELERGKENVPPPDFYLSQPRAQQQASNLLAGEADDKQMQIEHAKLPRLRNLAQDAMDEDRKPLGDLPAAEFYGEGCDATSYVTVDAGIEKPSSLSRELERDCPSPEKNKTAETEALVVAPVVVVTEEKEEEVVTPTKAEDPILIHADVNETLPSIVVKEDDILAEATEAQLPSSEVL